MTLLTVVQDAMTLTGLASPAIAYSSTDKTVKQMVALAQHEGDSLMSEFDWPGIKALATVTGDGTSTEFNLPTDFHRWLPGSAFYKDNSPLIPLTMVTDEEMRQYKEAAATPIYPVWRRIGDTIEFYPAPANGDVYKSEYRSIRWIVDDDATTRKSRWEADTDYSAIPEGLIMLGVIWRYKASRGFDYAEDYRNYMKRKLSEMGAQTGRPNIISGDGYTYRTGSDPKVTPYAG